MNPYSESSESPTKPDFPNSNGSTLKRVILSPWKAKLELYNDRRETPLRVIRPLSEVAEDHQVVTRKGVTMLVLVKNLYSHIG